MTGKKASDSMGTAVHDTAKIYNNVRVTDSSVGEMSVLCDNVDVIRSRVGARCSIGRRNLFLESNLGDGSYTGSNTEVRNCDIGRYCCISWNVSLGGANHNYKAASMIRGRVWRTAVGAEPPANESVPYCSIGNDVWIGSGACVISGVKVGDGAVIGAGAVVTRDVPPYSVVVGAPAKVIKTRFDKETVERLLTLKWWDWELCDIRKAAPLLQSDLNSKILEQLEGIAKVACMKRMDRKTKIAITGAGGFLGSELLRQASSNPALEILAISSKSRLAVGEGLVEVVTPEEALYDEGVLDGVDVLINCAFPRTSEGDQMARGLRYVFELLKRAREEKVGAIVNISSQSVYSQKRVTAADEEAEVCLESSYAVGKYAVELALESLCTDIDHTSIRLASLIGPGFEQRVVNKMAKKAISGESLVVDEGGFRYAYLDVRDAARGILAVALGDPASWDATYNLGPNDAYTLTQIAEGVRSSAARRGMQVFVDIRNASGEGSSELDSKRIRNSFGWSPLHGLDDSIEAILEDELFRQETEMGLRRAQQ